MKTNPNSSSGRFVQRGLRAALFAGTAVIAGWLVGAESYDPSATFASPAANGFLPYGGSAMIADGRGGPPETLAGQRLTDAFPGTTPWASGEPVRPDGAPMVWHRPVYFQQTMAAESARITDGNAASSFAPAGPVPDSSVPATTGPGMDYGQFSPVAEAECSPALPAHCGFACCPGWYAEIDPFLLNRVSTRGTTLSAENPDGLDEFGYKLGARLTLGHTRDCLLGWEFVYVGPYEWEEQAVRLGTDDLNPKFGILDPNIDDSAFHRAYLHREIYESKFDSYELNRKWFGWDVISTTLGIRYVHVREKYDFYSERQLLAPATGIETGLLQFETDNNLVGPQIGLDLYYPLGRFRSTLRGRAGIYGNWDWLHVSLENADQLELDNSCTDVNLAFLGEIGYHVAYRCSRYITILAGYELWYLYGVALATNQFDREEGTRIINNPAGPGTKEVPATNAVIDVSTGQNLQADEDIFYHGGFVGVQFNW